MKQTQQQTELTPEVIAGILATMQNQSASNPIMEILGKKLAREEAEREENERVQKESRRQNAMAMEEKRQQDLNAQAACSHLKPNNSTNVVGQRDHSNNYHYICQRCQKTWTGGDLKDPLPNFLYPDPNMVGGPQF